jgi:hypothetical protein
MKDEVKAKLAAASGGWSSVSLGVWSTAGRCQDGVHVTGNQSTAEFNEHTKQADAHCALYDQRSG